MDRRRIIHNAKSMAKFSGKLRGKIEDARDVLYVVKEEQEILGLLEIAIEKEDIHELQETIALAGQNFLSERAETIHAVKLCGKLQQRDKAKLRIEKLSNSKNANAILENADELLDAIEEAENLKVPSKYIDGARAIYEKIQLFLPLRNKMREAVERGSRKLMLSALEERRQQCESEGHGFCKEEQLAIKNMLRMFSFEVSEKIRCRLDIFRK